MQINIIQVGKTKNDFVKIAEAEFTKRLSSFTKINTITLKESKNGNTEQIKAEEASTILKSIPANSFVIALTEQANQMNSREFADFINNKQITGQTNITFIIGGPFGLAQSVQQAANLKMSFSELTFTHEMIRMLLLEQIYRAFTIIKNKKYHY